VRPVDGDGKQRLTGRALLPRETRRRREALLHAVHRHFNRVFIFGIRVVLQFFVFAVPAFAQEAEGCEHAVANAVEAGFVTIERVSVPATECPRIPPSFLEEERASMSERCFRQEYLCEFGEAEDALFSRELIERAITDEVKPLF
jgi:hypothetical protein